MKTHLTAAICVFISAYVFVPEATTPIVDTKPTPIIKPVDVTPTPTPEPEPVVKNGIVEIQTADWCAPCKRLKASGAIKDLENKGWDVQYVNGIGKSYPTIKIWVKGSSKTFSGFSSKSAFFRTFNKLYNELK